MATLYVAEFTNSAVDQGRGIPVGLAPPVTLNNVAIAGVSAQSLPFSAFTRLIRVHTDTTCSIKIGNPNQTATISDMRMVASQTEYFGIHPGDVIAVIINL